MGTMMTFYKAIIFGRIENIRFNGSLI